MIIAKELLQIKLTNLLIKYGVREHDAQIATEVLIEGNLRNYVHHGVDRIFQILEGLKQKTIDPQANSKVLVDLVGISVLDGNYGLGYSLGKYAMELAVEKAKNTGVGVVGVINSSHLGILAYYSEIASTRGCIGVVMSTTSPAVVVKGGNIKTFGTNPISYSIPHLPYPVTADFATSKVSRGVIYEYLKNGKKIPKTFEVVTYLMGPYIQAMGCHIFVRCPCAHAVENNIGKFHTDSGPSLQRILPVSGNLLLQLKVQFFLTDMLGENESNFLAIPGSHVRSVNYHHPYCLIPECNKYLEQGIMPPEAIQLKVKAGDVLIHMLNLWHAVASNESENTRLSISIRYGQMWFRDQHFKTSKDILLPRMTPRQRRLIGDYGDNPPTDIGYRAPDDQVTLMLGDKAAAYGWPLDWLKEGDGKKYL